jgi:hypothetical protein
MIGIRDAGLRFALLFVVMSGTFLPMGAMDVKNIVYQTVANGTLKEVKLFYRQGGMAKDTLLDGRSLDLSLINKKTNIAQFLLNQGAPIDWVNNDGDTLLHLSFNRADSAAIAFLLKNKADVTLKNHEGSTFFHCAAESAEKPVQVFECCTQVMAQEKALSIDNKKIAQKIYIPQFFIPVIARSSLKALLSEKNNNDETAMDICLENASDDTIPEDDRAGWQAVAQLLDPKN